MVCYTINIAHHSVSKYIRRAFMLMLATSTSVIGNGEWTYCKTDLLQNASSRRWAAAIVINIFICCKSETWQINSTIYTDEGMFSNVLLH